MRRDILLSGVIAVTIHALIFSLPLSKTKNNTRVRIYEPVSISIISLQETIAAVPPVQASIKPRSEARSHVSGRQTVISKKKVGSNKHPTVKNMTVKRSSPKENTKPEVAANSDNQHKLVKESFFHQMPKDQGKKIGSSPSVKTAFVRGHILRSGQKHMGAPQGNQRGRNIVVYARPKYKENPPPHYPKLARRRGYEGRTLLRVEVLENGKAGKIEIEGSSGFKVLDTAALRSVRDWTFVPGTKNGKETKQWVMVPVRFSLE